MYDEQFVTIHWAIFCEGFTRQNLSCSYKNTNDGVDLEREGRMYPMLE